MRKILTLLIFLSIFGCNKPKTVLICGDHVCINKNEAKQYFEDNLSIEVKILDKKKPKEINLVQLNLQYDPDKKKKITLFKKDKTNKELKILTKEEINYKKAQLKKKKKLTKKKNNKILKKEKKITKKYSKDLRIKTNKKSQKDIVDICNILEQCSIGEISKYLIKQGNKKDFPDITTQE